MPKYTKRSIYKRAQRYSEIDFKNMNNVLSSGSSTSLNLQSTCDLNSFEDTTTVFLQNTPNDEGNNMNESRDSECSYNSNLDCSDPIDNNIDKEISKYENIPCHSEKSIESNSEYQSFLAGWALEFRIPHNALNALLVYSHNDHPNLPLDARTLLKTPRDITFKAVFPGHYYHFGLSRALENLIKNYDYVKEHDGININVNIDGLPVSKSTNIQLYPILCNLSNHSNEVAVIGVYEGPDKPKDVNLFLEDFISDAKQLTNNGFQYRGRTHSFRIASFICDAPAKSFITCTKGHAGYNSCSKCYIEGEFLNNRVCFPDISNLKLRTDKEFRQKLDEDHHNGSSLIIELPNFDIVNNIPLDYMHLVCLGVTRKLLYLWCYGNPPYRLQHIKINKISNSLLAQQNNIPSEFVRKPRSLNELKRFKATEFRQFLLYTGPVVLKNILSENHYTNFICLHLAITILSNNFLFASLGQYAESMLKYFVETFIILYGKQHVSHNVHNLLHLYSDCKKFGVLDQFSAFPFENYLYKLKRLLRKGDKSLSQIVKRISEQYAVNKVIKIDYNKNMFCPKQMHFNGPLPGNVKGEQYCQIKFKQFILKHSEPDNCCSLIDRSVVCIENFVKTEDGLFLVGRKFTLLTDFYTRPCNSTTLGIFIVSQPSILDIWPVELVAFKYVKLILEDKNVVFPLLHSEV